MPRRKQSKLAPKVVALLGALVVIAGLVAHLTGHLKTIASNLRGFVDGSPSGTPYAIATASSTATPRPRIINTPGVLYRIRSNPQCQASSWRDIVSDGSIKIGLVGVRLEEKDRRADIGTEEFGDEKSELVVAQQEIWYDLPTSSRPVKIRVWIVDDCSVRYGLKETTK